MDSIIEHEIYVADIPKGKNWYSSGLKNFLSNDRFDDFNCVLRTVGYVGNRPLLHKEGHHEDDTWAIDVLSEDGDALTSFLYSSEFEYQEDLTELIKYI